MRASFIVAALVFVFAGAPLHAQHLLSPDQVVLEDVISVELVGRELVAFDLVGSGRLVERLEIGEEVLSTRARGRIALALTTRRMLAAAPTSGSWQAERYRISERPSEEADLSQGVALVVTSQRALAFFGSGWTEQSIGPRELLRTTQVGPGAGVVVTDRRALGVSAQAGGFFETKLRIGEDIQSVNAIASIVTLTTSKRVLVFKGASGRWVEHSRTLR